MDSDSPSVVVVSSSLGREEPSMEIFFADGPWVVPGWMIHLLGGAELISDELKLQLQTVKYADFTKGLMDDIANHNFRRALRSVIAGNFF